MTGAPGSPEGPGVAATRRWRLVVAYDGSGFRGFAEQPGLPTVAGALAVALARVTRLPETPTLVCAGRTDAGVHARGQVVHVDLPDPLPLLNRRGEQRRMGADDLAGATNRQLAPAIVVRSAAAAPEGFDARRSARRRAYRYLIWNAPLPDPLLARTAWYVGDPLDLRRMEAAADAVVGEHDFRSFCRRAPSRSRDEPIVRRVTAARWSVSGAATRTSGSGRTTGIAETSEAEGCGRWGGGGGGPGSAGWAGMGNPTARQAGSMPGERELGDAGPGRLLRFDIEAGSFCHQMVRSLVGELVQVGRGRGTAASMVALLRSADRTDAADPAPAHGLCLLSVGYDEV